MAKYTSNRQKNLKIGIASYSENLTSLEVIGNVGIGTTNAISKLYVVGDGYFTDVVTSASLNATNANITTTNIVTGIVTNLTGTNLNYSGISTLGVTSVTRLTAQSINSSGIVTGSTFRPSSGYIQAADGTNSFYIYSGTGNVAFQGTIGVGQINSSAGYKALEFSTSTTPNVLVTNNLNVAGVATASSFISTSTTLLAPTAGNYGGERIRLYDFNNNTKTNYAIGVEGSHVWFGVDSNLEAQGFKWYGDTTQVMRLSAAGNLSVVGFVTASNLFISGVTTSTGGFVGNLTGIAASATQLVTPRTFEITGDVVASPISFDGTGNVSLAATIQPNSVGLGTDTFGDYVKDIAGTSNQITVTGGTGEGSTPTLSLPTNLVVPQDLTVTRDLQVNRNLNITGNITIGGTTAFINVKELTVTDSDIILGYRTDAFNNDVSNDNTANHGGVALASTEGTPLVDLFVAGIETAPATYKKIMWFKEGTFAGLGTDAWLINYAVGIGSTQFPTGTRLAAGSVQFTENDLAVVRNINASGIVTASTANITNINISTGNINNANIVTGVVTTLSGTNLNYNGIGTITNLTGTTGTLTTLNANTANIVTGVVTTLSGTDATYTTGNFGTANVVTGVVTTISGSNLTYTTGNFGTANIVTGVVTSITGTTLNYTGIGTINTLSGTNLTYTTGNLGTANIVSGIVTSITGTNLNYSGIGTITTLNSTDSILTNINSTGISTLGVTNVTNLTTQNINNSGITTTNSLSIGATQVISSARQLQNIDSLDATTTATIEAAIANAPNAFTDLQVTGISTFTNGPVFIGSGTSTGTVDQKLQVTGGGYVSGEVSIGTTLTSQTGGSSKVHISGGNLKLDSNQELNWDGIYPSYIRGFSGINGSIKLNAGNSRVLTYSTNRVESNFSDLSPDDDSKIDLGSSGNRFRYIWSSGPMFIGVASSTGTASQSLQVSGGTYVGGNLGIGTTNPTEKLSVIGNILINDTTTQGSFKATTATTSPVGIHSALSTSTYRSVEYTIQATEGTNFHATKILALHDGSSAYLTEYGTIYNNASVSGFNIDVSGGNIRLIATPASASLTNYTINFTATKI